jgi:hypothetical protein
VNERSVVPVGGEIEPYVPDVGSTFGLTRDPEEWGKV